MFGGGKSLFGASRKVAPSGSYVGEDSQHHESHNLQWEIEEGHSNRVASQFQWDETEASDKNVTESEFTGNRRELLNLDKVIDKQMQWASGEDNPIERLDSHRAPKKHSARRQGSGGTDLYVIDDDDDGDEKKDSVGHMSGISFAKDGKPLVKPQALASDDQVHRKLLKTMKKNKEYEETMNKLREMYRKQLQKNNKLNEQLTQAQDDLHTANHSAATGGGGMFAAKINVNDVSAKEDEERARREKERKKLLQAGGDDGDDDALYNAQEGEMNIIQRIRYRVKKIMTKYDPLKKDVDQVEARFGSSVASYYRFNQWITKSSISIMIVYLALIVYQIVLKLEAGNVFADSTWYAKLFYYSSFYQGDMPLYYSLVLLLLNIVLVFISLNKWIVEDRKAKVINALQGNAKRFATVSLNCFDHTLHDEDDMNDLMMGNAEQFTSMLISEKIAETIKNRSFKDKAKLYSKRALLITIYLALQSLAIYGIFQLIFYEAYFTDLVFSQLAITKEQQASIPITVVPIVVSVINTIIPKIIIKLVETEAWDNKMDEVEQIVFRIFISKTINNVIQLVSYMLLSNPFFLQSRTELFPNLKWRHLRQSFAKKFDPTVYNSRMDMAGNSIFNIMVTEFVMHKIFLVLFPAIAWVMGKKNKKAMKKTAFNIELKMIGLLYYTQICLISLPLYPLAGVIMFITLYINFKSEKNVMFWSNTKPKGGGGGGGSLSFFLKFFLMSSIINVFYSTFLLTYSTFPKQCELQARSLPKNTTYDNYGIVEFKEHDDYELQRYKDDNYEVDECYLLLNQHTKLLPANASTLAEALSSPLKAIEWEKDPINSTETILFINPYPTSDSYRYIDAFKLMPLTFLNDVKHPDNKVLVLCACLWSEGPFKEYYNGLSPIITLNNGDFSFVSLITRYIIDVRLLITLVVFLATKPYFLGNTIKTNEEFHAEHELGYRDMIKSLTKRNNILQKKVNNL